MLLLASTACELPAAHCFWSEDHAVCDMLSGKQELSFQDAAGSRNVLRAPSSQHYDGV